MSVVQSFKTETLTLKWVLSGRTNLNSISFWVFSLVVVSLYEKLPVNTYFSSLLVLTL